MLSALADGRDVEAVVQALAARLGRSPVGIRSFAARLRQGSAGPEPPVRDPGEGPRRRARMGPRSAASKARRMVTLAGEIRSLYRRRQTLDERLRERVGEFLALKGSLAELLPGEILQVLQTSPSPAPPEASPPSHP